MKNIHKDFNLADFAYNSVFVETGTCGGVTVDSALKENFSSILSIELEENFYNQCKARFEGDKRVKLFRGKSHERLGEMIREINVPITFYLDAHPSGPHTPTSHNAVVLDGIVSEFGQHAVITRELEHIGNHRIKGHTILIDDQHGPNSENQQYVEYMESFGIPYFSCFINRVGYKDMVLAMIPESVNIIL